MLCSDNAVLDFRALRSQTLARLLLFAVWQVYAMVDEAGSKLSPAARELMLAAFQAGCLASAPGVGGGSAEEGTAMDL